MSERAGDRKRRVGHRSKLDGMDTAGFYFYLSVEIPVSIFIVINFIALDSESNTDSR